MSRLVTLLVLSFCISESLCCAPAPPEEKPRPPPRPPPPPKKDYDIVEDEEPVYPGDVGKDEERGYEDPRFAGNLSDPTKWMSQWPGEPPNEEYNAWLNDHKDAKTKHTQDWLAIHGVKDAHGNLMAPLYPANAPKNFPGHWKYLGPREPGYPPPPHAVIAGAKGKPRLCFLPPSIGDCKEYEVRWGYNMWLEDCKEFVWSGCGGNLNNFKFKKQCMKTCTLKPEVNCKGDSNKTIDTFITWDEGVRPIPNDNHG